MVSLPLRLTLPVHEGDHVVGPPSAPITIVEYGDYQCPFCKAAQPLVAGLQAALGDNLRYVFRHFPLTSLHPEAEQAAEAAEAAATQGRFWEMHALLYENQQSLDEGSLLRLAGTLDLDWARFEHDLAHHAYSQRVRDDLTSGLRSGVRGTPTFFIDGVRWDEPLALLPMLEALRERHPELSIALPASQEDVRVAGMTHHAGE